MRKLVDDVRLIFKCCSLYYQDGIGQREICQILGISRPTVSRMLSAGKAQGIVKIEIRNPDNLLYGQVEREMEKTFGLQEVIIVPSSFLPDSNIANNPELGRAALKFMTRILRDGDYIGVSMGSALQSTAHADYFIANNVKCTFVPVLGGVGESYLEFHSNYLAQTFAERFGAECVQLFAPALFSKQTVLADFLKERTIRKVTTLYQKLDVLVMGIGCMASEQSTVLHTGYVDHKTLEDFNSRGAVGDIILRYFDANGNTEPFADFNERVAGINLKQLKRIPLRVGIAGGEHKVKAILGAINGKYLNVLITDIDCAQGLLDLISAVRDCQNLCGLKIGRSAESITPFNFVRRICRRICICCNVDESQNISRSMSTRPAFNATANTVNLNFYDKHAQLQSKSYLKASDIETAKNLLRLEVQCKFDYLQKLKRKFELDGMSVRDFWDANIAEHVLRYRIKMLVGEQDFYRLDEAERKLKLQAGNNAFILCSLLRDIAQADDAQSAKENFCRKHSGISFGKYDKFLHKLRKKFGINPLTFPVADELPTVLKNPCALITSPAWL